MASVRSETYVKHVLSPTYQFTKRHHLHLILEINFAHVLMLMKQNIISKSVGQSLLRVNADVYRDGFEAEYNSQYEDLFFMLEEQMARHVGQDTLGNMHIAFSRNDMDATMFRMCWREKATAWLSELTTLRRSLLLLSDKYRYAVMPAYTHGQQAQPTTIAHYLVAAEAHLRRDCERGLSLLTRINKSPMGACALGTTGFPIDRQYVGELLGFDGLVLNSYDAVAAADYMLEIGAVLNTSFSFLSRFVSDLIFMTTNEVQTLKLHDSLVQTSSIMPQKRNPSALEHTRAMISRSIGELSAVYMMSHSVPFGDIVDIGDDIQPILQNGFDHATQVHQLLTEILNHCDFQTELLYERCRNGFSTVTEIADMLVREYHISFRQAHAIVSRFVQTLAGQGQTPRDCDVGLLNTTASQVLGKDISIEPEQYQQAIDPEHFVSVRQVQGGPSPSEVQRQIQEAEQSLDELESAVKTYQQRFTAYRSRILDEVERVMNGKQVNEN
jgi:argininosuccinate lyase